ncbi:serine hydrolase domain-containing protein [Kribbella sp. NPDC000426]|uniref:serine hydrolase domain-containing protein n=1 Tax=Kribbella sp. NPDC000426 TaxID=3154255 RepID=UPI00332E5DD5
MASQRALLPRSTPAAAGISSTSILALLDELEAQSIECHSLMIVYRGQVVAEGWWTPYSAERPHLLYSLTKSFTSIAVGLAIADGLLSVDDRVVDVLPDHVPSDVSEQGRRITVHHLLSMTAGHGKDSLEEAWELEPADLVKGFLRAPFVAAEGTQHDYDNATTFLLARMVERVTGRELPEFLDERLFKPMGIDHAEWDRVASGLAFGFHGLHLTTEAIAAFGKLLLHGGRWGDQQLVPREWVELATRRHIETLPLPNWAVNPDFTSGYGYQFWISRHGYFGHGSFGQYCAVVPSHDLVIAFTGTVGPTTALPGIFWDHLLDAAPPTPEHDPVLADRLRHLSLPPVAGTPAPDRSLKATLNAAADSPLPEGTPVTVDPTSDGWLIHLGPSLTIKAGHNEWHESSPLGRPVVASAAWQNDTFVADLYVITTPHRVRLTITTPTATATWNTVPLTGPNLTLHLKSPLITRPDVS